MPRVDVGAGIELGMFSLSPYTKLVLIEIFVIYTPLLDIKAPVSDNS